MKSAFIRFIQIKSLDNNSTIPQTQGQLLQMFEATKFKTKKSFEPGI